MQASGALARHSLPGRRRVLLGASERASERVQQQRRATQQTDAICLLLDTAARQAAEGEAEDATPISRLTSSLLKHLLKGFTAKDKNVRFRSTQFVATLMSGLGELE